MKNSSRSAGRPGWHCVRSGWGRLLPRSLALGFVIASFLVGCIKADASDVASPLAAEVAGHGSALRLTAFRIRADFDAELNTDSGWAATTDAPAVVAADRPFRLRFEVENTAQKASQNRFQMQYRRNHAPWTPLPAEDFPYPIKQLSLDFAAMPIEELTDTLYVGSGTDATLLSHRETGGDFARLIAGNRPVLAAARYQVHWEAVELATSLRLPDSSTVGIVFGYLDEGNHYRLDVEAGKALRIMRLADGRKTTLVDRQVNVKPDHWIEVKVTWEGSQVTVDYEWDPHLQGIGFTADLEDTISSAQMGLYLPAGSSADLRYLDIEGETSTPGVSIVSNARFEHGAPTQDLLAGSSQPFAGGAGINYAPITPAWSAAGAHGEWEFPLVIRYFHDGPGMNEEGDHFEFRLVDRRGVPVQAANSPAVTLAVPEQHLGGVFVETPMRIGPWEASNGDLYFLEEPSETDNRMMMVKSSDGGKTWREVDGANRPRTGDLEGVGQALAGNRIHTLHQTSDHVYYHVFRTSDHPSEPDSWEIADERLASPVEPPVQVADIAVRSDGSVVGVYGNLEKVLVRIRSPQGQWGEETMVDPELDRDLSGPVIVRGKDDVVHFAYTGIDGTAWYRQILPNGDLTPARLLASGLGTNVEAAGGILPLVYLPESDRLSIIYRLDNGELWERRVDAAGALSSAVRVTRNAVVTNAADAEQVGADAIGYGASVHVLFIEEGTGRLFHTWRNADGDWSTPTLEVDDADVQWVRGAVVKQHDKGAFYGYIYDAGSQGGSGMNRYAEQPLPAIR